MSSGMPFRSSRTRRSAPAGRVHAHAAAHARIPIHPRPPAEQVDRAKLAALQARPAAGADLLVHLADEARRGQHGHAVEMGLHRAAAALAAVADRIEAAQHRVLEERVVNVAPLVLVRQDSLRLVAGDPARAIRLVFRRRNWQTARRRSGKRREAGRDSAGSCGKDSRAQ